MALRQMGIARMGNYRPKHDAVQRGGKVGRPKLLHNGTGHGLTGGGGLNAKGTGGGIKVNKAMKPMQRQLRKSKYQSNKFNAMKINEREKNRAKRAEEKTRTTGGTPMNPHPTGSFMYGQNQWGYINPRGMVDWTSQQPKAGKPVIGFNQALPWLQRTPNGRRVASQFLQNRRVRPAAYWDPIYFRNKSAQKLERDQAFAQLDHQGLQLNHDYDWARKELLKDYDGSVHDANSDMGARGVAGSGVSNAMLGDLSQQLLMAQAKNEEQNTLSRGEIDMNRLMAKQGYDVGLAGEEGMARERWMSTHQGQKLPPSNKGKIYVEGGITYRNNASGIPQTWTQRPKKPKHPNAKTYTSGGKVRKIGGN